MKVIGTEHTYTDNGDHPALDGIKVRVGAVIRTGDEKNDNAGSGYYTSDEDLERHGGLQDGDLLDVAPWKEERGRYSWIRSPVQRSSLSPGFTPDPVDVDRKAYAEFDKIQPVKIDSAQGELDIHPGKVKP